MAKKRKQTPLEKSIGPEGIEVIERYVDQRIGSLEAQMLEFREKRKIYYAQMIDDFSWRKDGRALLGFDDLDSERNRFSDIFRKQNDSLNIVGGFAAFLVARAVDDIFGTSPYYALTPEGIEDEELAKTMQKHSEWKLNQSNWKDTAIGAIDIAIGLGEAVIKSTWVRKVDVYEEQAMVLVGSDGEPILDDTGDFITADDVVEDELNDEATGLNLVGFDVPKLGTFFPGTDVYLEERNITRTNVEYDNTESSTLHHEDLIAPLNVSCLSKADFVGQRCQMYLNDLRERYGIDDDTYDQLISDSMDPKTKEAQPDRELGETQEGIAYMENPNPIIEFVEAWIRLDPKGDKRMRRMYVIYVPLVQKVILADYIANVTPKGEIPYHVVRAYPVKNRWYGRGLYEIYEKAQTFIDKQFNLIGYKNLFSSNPMTVYEDGSLILPDDQEEFRFEPGAAYKKKAQTDREVFHTYSIPDLDDRTWQLMQMMIQVIQVRSGITSAAQGEVSSLPSTATATGIESIMQSANTLARLPLNNMKSGLEDSLYYNLALIYSNISEDEVFTYFDGDEQKVGTLVYQDIKDLKMNVRLILTRFKQREMLEQATKALEIIEKYIAIPEPEKPFVRPAAIQALRGLGIEGADAMIREAIPMDQQPPVQPQAAIEPVAEPMEVLA